MAAATGSELEILRQIARQDPDGWETEPTEADYAAFKQAVIYFHGEAMWKRYHERWEPCADV